MDAFIAAATSFKQEISIIYTRARNVLLLDDIKSTWRVKISLSKFFNELLFVNESVYT